MGSGKQLSSGQILIAKDPGRGGYFDQSVVLLLEHNSSGTVGVCLDKTSDYEMIEVFEPFEPQLSPPAVLFEGGPVSPRAAVCLAQLRNPEHDPPGWHRLFDDVGILDLDTPPELVEGGYAHLRIFVGLAGWDAGQLEGELIRGSWFRTGARAEEVFSSTPAELWRRSLRRMGGTASYWSTWTEVPELN